MSDMNQTLSLTPQPPDSIDEMVFEAQCRPDKHTIYKRLTESQTFLCVAQILQRDVGEMPRSRALSWMVIEFSKLIHPHQRTQASYHVERMLSVG